MIIEFKVPGEPKPQMKGHACIRGAHAAIYVPKEAQDRKYNIQKYAIDAMKGQAPCTGPVSIEVLFVLSRPGNMCWKTRPMPRYPHTKHGRGDIDNFLKAVLDALIGVCYLDDSQVFTGQVTKMVAEGGEAPFTLIKVEML